MKRLLFLFISSVLAASIWGCGSASQQSSLQETWEIPTAVSLPDTMTVDQLLYIVNEHLGYEDESSKVFYKENAEVFNVPATEGEDEVLYLFMVGDLEIALFASKEKDCVVSAYVRALLEDDQVETYMMSLAGVMLAALEPNEYETMLSEVLPSDEGDKDVSGTSAGEAWNIVYNRYLINITPKEDADQIPES